MMQRLTAAAHAAWSALTESSYQFGGAAIDTVGASADYLFRSLRSGAFDRDLPTHLQEQILRTAWWAYVRNPLAKRGIDTTRDFVVGDGIKLKADDERLQMALEQHWHLPANRWDQRLAQRELELSLYGEWCQAPLVNEVSGEVRWVAIDPLMIGRVELDPSNPDQAQWVVLKDPLPGLFIGTPSTRPADPDERMKRRRLRVIHRDERMRAADGGPNPTYGRLVGDCVWAGINRTTYATRGISDLACVLDWLEMHEDFLTAIQEAARSKVAHLWDVEIAGADAKQLEQFARQFGEAPGSGTVRFHSDKVRIQNIAPELATTELDAHSRLIKRHIAVGLGIPEHWLGESPGGSGEGAIDAGTPATKRLRGRARQMRELVRLHLDFAMDCKRIAGTLPSDVDPHYKLITPPLAVIDVQRIAASVQTVTQAMIAASAADASGEPPLVSRDEARQVVLFAISQLGIDAESLSRDTQSPATVRARDVADPDKPPAGAQPDQLAQRSTAADGGLAAPPLGGMNIGTLQGGA